MKKSVGKIIACMMIFTLFTGVGGVVASANFGVGVQVMAEGSSLIKTGLFGKRMSFSEADFKCALNIDDFNSVTITTVPSSTEGTLTYGGRRVIAGRVIKRKNLGLLSFIPASDSVSEARFTFTVEPSSGTAVECVMRFVDKVNYAPTVDDATAVSTQGGIAYFGRLDGHDPEGDGLEFMVVSYPKNGELTLDKVSGRYSYMPREGFVGKDKFTFVVRDSYGNFSEAETVTIKVIERMCDTVFVDMEGRREYNGAVAMAAMGIMSGKIVGDDIYFEAETTVTRAEFIAMAMKAMGIKADSTLAKSFFDDDGDIPKSLKPYVATAARLGIATGDFVDGRLLFQPNEEITNYEIAEILAVMGGIGKSEEAEEFDRVDGAPVWARASVSAMYTLGVFDIEDTAPDAVATRAEVADYLYKMMLVCE